MKKKENTIRYEKWRTITRFTVFFIFISLIMLYSERKKFTYLYKITCLQFIISIIFHFKKCREEYLNNIRYFDLFICFIYFNYISYLSYKRNWDLGAMVLFFWILGNYLGENYIAGLSHGMVHLLHPFIIYNVIK